MAFRYLVVLDKNSPVGKMYAEAKPAFRQAPGGHPVLDCTAIVIDSPYYIEATHSLAQVGGKYQSIFLPHGSVVQILRYNEEEGVPFGFALPKSPT